MGPLRHKGCSLERSRATTTQGLMTSQEAGGGGVGWGVGGWRVSTLFVHSWQSYNSWCYGSPAHTATPGCHTNCHSRTVQSILVHTLHCKVQLWGPRQHVLNSTTINKWDHAKHTSVCKSVWLISIEEGREGPHQSNVSHLSLALNAWKTLSQCYRPRYSHFLVVLHVSFFHLFGPFWPTSQSPSQITPQVWKAAVTSTWTTYVPLKKHIQHPNMKTFAAVVWQVTGTPAGGNLPKVMTLTTLDDGDELFVVGDTPPRWEGIDPSPPKTHTEDFMQQLGPPCTE